DRSGRAGGRPPDPSARRTRRPVGRPAALCENARQGGGIDQASRRGQAEGGRGRGDLDGAGRAAGGGPGLDAIAFAFLEPLLPDAIDRSAIFEEIWADNHWGSPES